MRREDVPARASALLGGRFARWGRTIGDYDGRDRTLEVFDADPSEQRELGVRINASEEIREAAGGPLVVIFHSRKQTAEMRRRGRL